MTIDIDDAINALLAYQQADMEGTMVLTSRQAIHEVANEIRRIRADAQPAPDSVREALETLASYELVAVGFNGAFTKSDLKDCTWVCGFSGPQPEFRHFEAARAALAAQPPAAPVETDNRDSGGDLASASGGRVTPKGCRPPLKDAPQSCSAATEHAKVADWLDDQAIIATNSLHCGDNSAMIHQTHDWAEKLEAAARHLRAVPQTSGVWQPIETAPKEPEATFLVCAVGDTRGPFVVRSDILWQARKAGTPSHLGLSYLTHWMPLPEMPQ